jgi:hypothetical protein
MLDYSNTSIKTDENGYLVLPNTASFDDAKREVIFYPEAEIKEGRNVIGKISYIYGGKYVGGADILFNNTDTPTLYHTFLNSNSAEENEESTETEGTSDVDDSGTEHSDGHYRPIIIAVIVGCFVLVIGLYYLLVEKPRLERKRAYYKRRAERKRYMDDNYLDL